MVLADVLGGAARRRLRDVVRGGARGLSGRAGWGERLGDAIGDQGFGGVEIGKDAAR
jgi:hypothetical protein